MSRRYNHLRSTVDYIQGSSDTLKEFDKSLVEPLRRVVESSQKSQNLKKSITQNNIETRESKLSCNQRIKKQLKQQSLLESLVQKPSKPLKGSSFFKNVKDIKKISQNISKIEVSAPSEKHLPFLLSQDPDPLK